MISKIVFFTATCDRCGKKYCKYDDESMLRLFNSKYELKEELNEVGWVVSSKILCRECYKYYKHLKTSSYE